SAPIHWAWRHWRERSADVTTTDWFVEVARSTSPAPPGPPPNRGWVPLRELLRKIATQLDRWAPRIHIGSGVVRFPGGEVEIGSAQWANHALDARGVVYRTAHADVIATFASEDRILVNARRPDGSLAGKITSRGTDVEGDLTLWEQPASVKATFGAQGWLPTQGLLRANSWTVSGERLKLGELYSAVRGSADVEWRTGQF